MGRSIAESAWCVQYLVKDLEMPSSPHGGVESRELLCYSLSSHALQVDGVSLTALELTFLI